MLEAGDAIDVVRQQRLAHAERRQRDDNMLDAAIGGVDGQRLTEPSLDLVESRHDRRITYGHGSAPRPLSTTDVAPARQHPPD